MSKDANDKRANKFMMRLSDAERDVVDAKAKRVGLSRTVYMRQAALGRKMPPAIDSEAILLLRQTVLQQREIFNEFGDMLDVEEKALLEELSEAALYQIQRLS